MGSWLAINTYTLTLNRPPLTLKPQNPDEGLENSGGVFRVQLHALHWNAGGGVQGCWGQVAARKPKP